ncbi:MAG: putative lipid II flippase FtsW [bacterium]|nr:putative lipid II flippase FtsW [bacterium]
MGEKRHAPDYLLLAVILILVGVGVLLVFSSSTSISYARYGNNWHYLRRQLIWAAIGLVFMYIVSRINYWKFRAVANFALIGSIILLVALFIPGVGLMANGSTRWIDIGFTTLQPSEIAKVALLVWTAHIICVKGKKISSFTVGSLPVLLITGLIGLLVAMQPDLGSATVIAAIPISMLFAAGMPWLQVIFVSMCGAGLVGAYAMIAPYRMARVLSFIDPWKDPGDTSWQLIQSLYAIGSGGLFGRGIGKSMLKLFFLPAPHNDFIFSVAAEEVGFIGCVLLIALFAYLVFRGMRIAINAPDRFGGILALGITMMIGLQALVNMMVVTGSMPVTGITLPLISYGGSSLVINMASLGILLNISKYSTE